MTPPPQSHRPTSAPEPYRTLLATIAAKAETSGLFASVAVKDDGQGRLVAAAKESAAPAAYRLDWLDGRVWISLVTSDRWLSQSIEQDLVHTGDKLEDLLEEELADLAPGFPAAAPSPGRPIFEHFRSEDLLFTFRSPVPVSGDRLGSVQATDTAALWLLAYEATFRRLGDMEASDEDE